MHIDIGVPHGVDTDSKGLRNRDDFTDKEVPVVLSTRQNHSKQNSKHSKILQHAKQVQVILAFGRRGAPLMFLLILLFLFGIDFVVCKEMTFCFLIWFVMYENCGIS